jgi:hypothetical protein
MRTIIQSLKTVALAGLLLLPVRLDAQFALDWFTIDGGGGTSAGGAYSISGTIGQPDAGSMSGGSFALVGGFWGVFSAIQTPGAPLLSIEPLDGSNVRVFWLLPANGFVLDETPALAGPPVPIAWSQVSFPYQTNASQISITVPASGGNRFYRLRKP